jgi:hypothetical protein
MGSARIAERCANLGGQGAGAKRRKKCIAPAKGRAAGAGALRYFGDEPLHLFMAVIPLTLTISLCLVFTFVVFFLREQLRPRFGSAESEALLPLAEEARRLVPARAGRQETRRAPQRRAPEGHDDAACGCRTGKHAPCAGCLRRADTR